MRRKIKDNKTLEIPFPPKQPKITTKPPKEQKEEPKEEQIPTFEESLHEKDEKKKKNVIKFEKIDVWEDLGYRRRA